MLIWESTISICFLLMNTGHDRARPGRLCLPATVCRLLDRDEDRVADLALDVIGEVPLAGRVLDQDDLANADQPALAVARGDLHPGIEVDDVLPARRGVPVEVVLGLGLTEDDAGRRQALRQFAAAALFDPFDLDVAEVRFALGVGVEVVDAHELPPDPTVEAGRAGVNASLRIWSRQSPLSHSR